MQIDPALIDRVVESVLADTEHIEKYYENICEELPWRVNMEDSWNKSLASIIWYSEFVYIY